MRDKLVTGVQTCALPISPNDMIAALARRLTSGWGDVVSIGLSSGGGYVLWLWALKNIAATRVTVFLALSPVTAAALGVALLGEPATAGMMAGVVCVAAGLWAAGGEPRRAT